LASIDFFAASGREVVDGLLGDRRSRLSGTRESSYRRRTWIAQSAKSDDDRVARGSSLFEDLHKLYARK